MRTYYTNDFEGQWPTGTAAVVVALSEADARRKFNAMLRRHSLSRRCNGDVYTIHEVTNGPAIMLQDGNY
jgi:hypothetical protein